MKLLSVFVIAVALAAPVHAKTHLRNVAEIDNSLMMIAIAHEIRNSCDDISARMVRAMKTINALKARAEALGYTEDEIRAYVTSKSEKARMRSKAEGYLARLGVNAKNDAELCAFGKEQIAAGTQIGVLLR